MRWVLTWWPVLILLLVLVAAVFGVIAGAVRTPEER